MKTLAQQLSEYAGSLQPRDLPAEVRKQAKRLIIDTIGCAIGAYTSESSKIARDLASAFGSGRIHATIIGSGQTTSPDLAAFVNGVMIRYSDRLPAGPAVASRRRKGHRRNSAIDRDLAGDGNCAVAEKFAPPPHNHRRYQREPLTNNHRDSAAVRHGQRARPGLSD